MTQNQLRWIARTCGPVAADLVAENSPASLELLADLLRFLVGVGLLVLAAAISLLVN